MNKTKIILILIASLSLSFYSCGGTSTGNGGGTKKFTSRTGWKENDAKGWFFTGKKKPEKTSNGMVFVEGGTFTMGLVKDNVMKDWNNSPTRLHIRSYYIGETEITNYEYKEYLDWLQYTFPRTEPAFKEIMTGALPDTLVWINKLTRNDIYTESYLRHPSFNYYPVVGVSWLQANRYCDWLTDRVNEKELMDQGVIDKKAYTDPALVTGKDHFSTEAYKYNPKTVFESGKVIDTVKLKNKGNVRNKNPRISSNISTFSNLVTKYRLPTETEWEYAALGMSAKREYNKYKGKPVFENTIRSRSGKFGGMYLDNFKIGRGDYGGIGGWDNDGAAITCDVKKHPANDIGLYGMLGNVAEWTADVYRATVDDEGSDFNYYRGNQYQQMVSDKKGGFEKTETDKVIFDTLADGKRLYKGLPGEFKKVQKEDARSHRDGDNMSSLDIRGAKEGAGFDKNDKMYNAPRRDFIVDDKGHVIIKKDGQKRSTDVTDQSRVVKGGSWLDSSYWLDPGQRRYFNETEGASWIGFRVAQDHLGDANGVRRSAKGRKILGK